MEKSCREIGASQNYNTVNQFLVYKSQKLKHHEQV